MSNIDLTKSNFLARLRDRSGKLSRTPRKEVERSRQQVIETRFDSKAWSEERKESEHLQRDITDLFVGEGTRRRDEHGQIPDLPEDHDDEEFDGREPFENAPELIRDLWQTMYKPSPRFRKQQETYKDTRLNRKILKQVIEHPNYERLHDLTMSDSSMATMATHAFMDTLKQIVVQNQQAVRQSNRDRIDKENEGGGPGCIPIPGGYPGPSADGEYGGEGDEEGEGGGGDGQQGGDNSQGNDSADDIDFDDLMGDDFDDELDGESGGGQDHEGDDEINDQDLERAINSAMEEALDEADEIENIRRGIGLGRGEWAQMNPSQRLALLEKFKSPQMKALAEIVGRMKRFAMSMQAQKIIDAPDEAFDVETGNDLRRLLRSEYVYLGTEETKPYFYFKYAESDLLQYKMRGKEDAGKGPIFVAIDKSGSMSGQPFNWAMAVAESLRRVCQEQSRDYYVTFFGNNNDRHRFDFPKGANDVGKVIEFLSAVANGGTQFDGVLTEAVDRCVEYGKRGHEKADIVFITDGQAHLSPEWIQDYNAKREEHAIRQFSVFIGGAYDYSGSAPVKFLETFSDHVISANELTEKAAEKIFRHV